MTIRPHVLITGSKGQLGRELWRSFADYAEIVACDREAVDLAESDQLRAFIRNAAPDVILNAGAYTAVDRAESEREAAMAVNAVAPKVLAEEAQRTGALLVHYSTDYVFDGTKTGPWLETDAPSPLNVYGASKLAGETAIQQIGGRYLIFRTSWVYGPHGKNFLLTMLRLGRERERLSIVDDQVGAPTTSIALADATRTVVEGVLTDRYGEHGTWSGLYHMSCGGGVSWYGFAEAIFEQTSRKLGEKTPELHPIQSSEYPTPARRPHNSVLSNDKFAAEFGFRLEPWESALDRVIQRLR